MSDVASSKSSGSSSKISTAYVAEVLERLKNNQTRDTTLNTYIDIWRQLNKFIINLDNRDKHLSWEDKTALFGAYLVDKGVQSSTLKSYFSAIKFILKQDGYIWDAKKMILSALIRGCHLENDAVKIRLPIQKGLLEMLLYEISRKFGEKQPYLEILYQAIFCLAYYGMLRVGEIAKGPHMVKAPNVHVGDNKDKVQIVLYSSKTHGQSSRPQKIKISAGEPTSKIKGSQKTHFCPIKIAIKYMHIRGAYLKRDEAFFIFAYRSAIKPCQLRGVLRGLLKDLSLDSQLYDVHSFRIGRTCDLYKYGYSIEQIKVFGRWKSNAVYKYLKNH